MTSNRTVGHGKGQFSFESCPCCDCWSLRTNDGRFVRHFVGMGSVDYAYAHRVARTLIAGGLETDPEDVVVKRWVKRNSCIAGGRTIEDAKRIGVWQARWSDFMMRIQKRGSGWSYAFNDLVRQYGKPRRRYHTLDHVMACLRELDDVREPTVNAYEVEFALWFHDAIYDTRKEDNEARSAKLAYQVLREIGIDKKPAARVEALVLATKHDQMPTDPEARLVCDIDLSVLGATKDVFGKYESEIRAEYDWVPYEEYKSARARVLTAFLSRPAIYSTPHFRAKYEQRARENLTEALAKLK